MYNKRCWLVAFHLFTTIQACNDCEGFGIEGKKSTVDATREFDSWTQVSVSFVFILFSRLHCSSSHPFIYKLHHNPLVSGVRLMFVDQWSCLTLSELHGRNVRHPKLLGYLRGPEPLTLKTRLSAKPLLWKNKESFSYQWKWKWNRDLWKLRNGSTSSMVAKIISYLSSSWM